jgi:hypothetical protein
MFKVLVVSPDRSTNERECVLPLDDSARVT